MTIRATIPALLLAAALSVPLPAGAGETIHAQAIKARRTFLVTLLLRAPSEAVTVKLVHALEDAGSAEEALGAVTYRALQEWRGYSVLDSLVSVSPHRDCGVSI